MAKEEKNLIKKVLKFLKFKNSEPNKKADHAKEKPILTDYHKKRNEGALKAVKKMSKQPWSLDKAREVEKNYKTDKSTLTDYHKKRNEEATKAVEKMSKNPWTLEEAMERQKIWKENLNNEKLNSFDDFKKNFDINKPLDDEERKRVVKGLELWENELFLERAKHHMERSEVFKKALYKLINDEDEVTELNKGFGTKISLAEEIINKTEKWSDLKQTAHSIAVIFLEKIEKEYQEIGIAQGGVREYKLKKFREFIVEILVEFNALSAFSDRDYFKVFKSEIIKYYNAE